MENNELEHIAPTLAKIKNQGVGFEIPKGYLNSIEESVEQRIQLQDSVPDNYFESLEDNVFEKIYKEPKVINFQQRIIKKVIPYIAAASILLLVVFQINNANSTDTFANLNETDIEELIDDGIIELNAYEIASVYSDEDFENLEINQYNESDLINYLDDIDVESLMLTN